jgi:hypothetical protein
MAVTMVVDGVDSPCTDIVSVLDIMWKLNLSGKYSG